MYSGGAADMKQSDNDIVCDFFTWHAGGGNYILTDEYNNVSNITLQCNKVRDVTLQFKYCNNDILQ